MQIAITKRPCSASYCLSTTIANHIQFFDRTIIYTSNNWDCLFVLPDIAISDHGIRALLWQYLRKEITWMPTPFLSCAHYLKKRYCVLQNCLQNITIWPSNLKTHLYIYPTGTKHFKPSNWPKMQAVQLTNWLSSWQIFACVPAEEAWSNFEAVLASAFDRQLHLLQQLRIHFQLWQSFPDVGRFQGAGRF